MTSSISNKEQFKVEGGWGWGGGTMYTHVSKCKNNKIKGEKIKVIICK
jgi:hypothetical protein